MGEEARPEPATADFDFTDGVNRVAGHTFTVCRDGAPIEMDQPACAYPGGVSQADIDHIYAHAVRSEWFSLAPTVLDRGDITLCVAWQGLWFMAGDGLIVCIENARASVGLFGGRADGDLTVDATFGPPLFDGLTAELPVRFDVTRSGADGRGLHDETFVIEGAGGWRRIT